MDIYELKARQVGSDIKAEIIAGDLIEAGVDLDDIVIAPMGLADRVFSRDVLNMHAHPDKLGLKELLNIAVSREGIYDGLPEALFHTLGKGKRTSAATFVDEYKKRKVEEENARQFFLAFEKELYRLRILLELNERQSILGFSDDIKSDLFLNLWPELSDIPEKYVDSMVLMIPLAHKIIGDINFTAQVLSYILNESISINYSNSARFIANTTTNHVLGANYLGYNTIIGNQVPDYTPKADILIGPLKKGSLTMFMPGGDERKVLDLALKYLLPVALDINIVLLLDNFDENLILSNEANEGRLGFTSRL